jgi:hypothetical protein
MIETETPQAPETVKKPKPEKPTRVHHPVPRDCAVCRAKKPEPVLQFCPVDSDGKWQPYLAHVSCVGSESVKTPMPDRPAR